MSYFNKEKVEAVAKDMKRESIKLTTETSTIATLQSEKAELVECLEFVNKEISKYKYDHKIVGHLGKCQFKIEQLLTKIGL